MRKFGIDISTWQGDFNLSKAKSQGVEFVIVKCGGGDAGLYVDGRFAANYKKAKDLGMPVGAYWFSKALNVTQAKKEAEYCYNNCLKGRQFELPIYIDVENQTQLNIGKANLTAVIKAWCDYLIGKGYFVGIYSSRFVFSTYMNDSELKKYAHWIAQWSSGRPTYTPTAAFGMWQFGGETNYIRSNKVAGQVCDQDYMLIDYPSIIKKGGYNGFTRGEPVQKPAAASTAKPTSFTTLAVDGQFGPLSVKEMQRWLGTYQDGVISGQLRRLQEYYPSVSAVTFEGGGSACITALQKLIKKKGCDPGTIDGIIGYKTVVALQKYLNKNGAKISVDGYWGKATSKAFQAHLNKAI